MRAFITGITGTLGTEVTRILLAENHEVIGYSRDEQKQRVFKYRDKCTMYLGDVRDKDRLLEASRGADIIFHFAALKCVDSLEENPEESVATNIIGTQNVLYAQRINGILKVCFASTDKAVSPINVYGMCKGISEKLVLRNPSNVVCRYGNVIGSRGSVIPMFEKTLRDDQLVNITSTEMTRFWIKIEDAAEFVFHSGLTKCGLQIPFMKAASVVRVANAVANKVGVNPYRILHVGVRPGEKLHERLQQGLDSFHCDQYTDQELMEMIK